jgi:hypothetical protein
LELIPLADGRTVVIATERPDNPGTSVTNAAEELASQVCQRFDIDPDKLVWIESYPADPCPRCASLGKVREPGKPSRRLPCPACRDTGRRRERASYDRVTFRRAEPNLPLRPSARARHGVRNLEEPHWRPMRPDDWAALGLESR